MENIEGFSNKCNDQAKNKLFMITQIKNLLEFLKSSVTRTSSLELLLGLTENNDFVGLIKETEAAKLLIRGLEKDDMTKEEVQLALQILVNLSCREDFIDYFVSINTTIRLAKYFLAKIDSEIKVKPLSDDNMFSLDLDLGILGVDMDSNKKDYKENAQQIMENYVIKKNDLDSDQQVIIPYILMIIANLTTQEKGQKQLFCSDKEEYKKLEGVIFLKMMEKFFENIYREELNFMSSILANISALKEGREFILEYKIFSIILSQSDKMNNFQIVNILRVFRNCCFEFEKFESELLVKDGFMLVLIFKVLIEANIKKEFSQMNVSSIDSIHFTHFKSEIASNEKEIINDLVVDIFVVLTNTTTAFPIIVKKGLKNVWEVLETRIKGSEIEDRLLVVSNFLSIH